MADWSFGIASMDRWISEPDHHRGMWQGQNILGVASWPQSIGSGRKGLEHDDKTLIKTQRAQRPVRQTPAAIPIYNAVVRRDHWWHDVRKDPGRAPSKAIPRTDIFEWDTEPDRNNEQRALHMVEWRWGHAHGRNPCVAPDGRKPNYSLNLK